MHQPVVVPRSRASNFTTFLSGWPTDATNDDVVRRETRPGVEVLCNGRSNFRVTTDHSAVLSLDLKALCEPLVPRTIRVVDHLHVSTSWLVAEMKFLSHSTHGE